MIEKNAKIISTFFGIEDHGIMTFTLDLDFAGSGQSYGMYALDGKSGQIEKSRSIQAIRKVLETVGVMKWEDLKGKLIRVRKETEFGQITHIGHILEDKWFSLKEHFEAT